MMMREATADRMIAAGFGLLLGEIPADGTCKGCGHRFGPHRFLAPGSPLDGGVYYCQRYPDCPCTGTWDTTCPEDMKARYRGL
jgi:hypothetical protein